MDYSFEQFPDKLYTNLRKCTDTFYKSDVHYHDCYELYFLLSGQRNYLRGTNIFPLKQNCISLTKPHIIHGTTGGAYSRICINFSKEFLLEYYTPKYLNFLLEIFSNDVIFNADHNKSEKIKNLFYDVYFFDQEKQSDSAAHYIGLLLLELHGLNDLQQKEKESPIAFSSLAQNICDYTKKNLHRIEKLSDLTEQFYFSTCYLSHYFKKETGFTFTEYLIELRMQTALHLLCSTDLSINKIAQQCGYMATNYFCLCFKKKFNLSPTQYRKHHKTK